MKNSFPVIAFASVILVFLAFLALLYVPPLKSHWLRESNALLAAAADPIGATNLAAPITEAEVDRLPEPMRRYLRFAGVIGTPRVNRVHVKLRGQFKMSTNADWMKITVDQVNTLEPAGRSFYIHGKPWPFAAISGIDSYEAGEGRMRIRLFSRIPILDVKSEEITESALVTLLNDMVMFPQAFLATNIRYQAIDQNSVEATYTVGSRRISATLGINAKGELTNFTSTNRWRLDGKTAVRETWTTPFSRYTNIGGIRVPGRGEAIHHYEDGPFTYARFSMPELVRVNLTNLE